MAMTGLKDILQEGDTLNNQVRFKNRALLCEEWIMLSTE